MTFSRTMKQVGVFSAAVAMLSIVTVTHAAPNARNTSPPPPTATSGAGAVIIHTSGLIMLGVNNEGHLDIPGAGPPSSGSGTTAVGLRYIPTGAEFTAPGCLCEGWGVSGGGVSGYAARDLPGGISGNVSVDSFGSNADSAVSVVTVGASFRVTHDYHSSSSPLLYECEVTIENISGADIPDLQYRRVFDFDVEPTFFDEFMTIDHGTAADLAFTSTNGFDSPDPLAPKELFGFYVNGPVLDLGPTDHGALFQFAFGALGNGASKSFKIFYGASADEAGAIAALGAVGAEAFALGQPNTPDGPTLGTPNTAIFAFGEIGGAPVFPIPTVSEWGLVALALLLLVGSRVYFGRRRRLAA